MALWFPCVLWNCIRPEQLWCLNPKKILNVLPPLTKGGKRPEPSLRPSNAKDDNSGGETALDAPAECWICYDNDLDESDSSVSSSSSSSFSSSSSSSRRRVRGGRAMISPCDCKGDVGMVHHDCLKRWLVESADNPDSLRCKVCNAPYLVEKGSQFSLATGFTLRQWVATATAVTVMCGTCGG